MIQKVGKYENTDEYLPQVKAQFKSMQKIVDEIIYLNKNKELELEVLNINDLVEDCLSNIQFIITSKNINVKCLGSMETVVSDRSILIKIIDNLLSNAVVHSKENQLIEITYDFKSITIRNYGTQIDKELLPHIFEPFVTSNNKEKGHGLGLYIVSYYVQIIQCSVEIFNEGNCVVAQIIFK